MISKGVMTVLMLLLSCFKTAWFSSSTPMVAQEPRGESLTYVSYTYDGGDEQKEFKMASGKKLSFDLETGASLTISGWNKEVVSVKVLKAGRDAENCEVSFHETSSGLEISSRYRNHRNSQSSDVDMEIMVPQNFDIEIDSMGGSVSIQNVEGEISGKTMGGELTLSQLKGDLSLTTMGGDITLTDSVVDGEVKTMGGTVTLQDVSGTVQGHTMGGDVIYKNVKGNPSSSVKQEVKVSSMGGEINVDEAPFGADVKTMGGDVRVRSASQFVKAETMGGDIDIDSVNGWIQAKTMGGDVSATMVGDPSTGKRDVEITSHGGDITLVVPDGLSMNFDLELAYTRHHEDDVRIISDFDVKQESSDKWDDEDGSPRKYIYGTGTVGDGANTIRIRTINGNITIKKGSR